MGPDGQVLSALEVNTNTHLVTAVTNAIGVTRYGYDSALRLASAIHPSGMVVSNFYFNTVADSNRLQATVVYESLGGAPRSTNSFTYANGVTVATAYDPAGRVVRATYPTGGGYEEYGYSTNVAASTSCTNQMGFVTRYAFDSLGRKTNEVFGAGTPDAVTNSYVYNGAGDLLSLRDGRGNTVSWTYDEYGRVKSKRDANNTEILQYQYDALGRLTNRWTAAKGNTYNVFRHSRALQEQPGVRCAVDRLKEFTNAMNRERASPGRGRPCLPSGLPRALVAGHRQIPAEIVC